MSGACLSIPPPNKAILLVLWVRYRITLQRFPNARTLVGVQLSVIKHISATVMDDLKDQ